MIINKDARGFFKSKINNFNTSFCNDLEQTLEKLRQSDFFGTEGQCDPRGDFREATIEETCDNCDDMAYCVKDEYEHCTCSDCCEECEGSGMIYIDNSSEMININEDNVSKIIETILSEDQKHNIAGIWCTYLNVKKENKNAKCRRI